ncbi:MAG: ATP-grasp domain-containing protein [Deltaproteobacteria bacterium]|nr:ATP-grasp domain-containing protein [Deltaproteobacteria bacterium]
MNLKGVEPPQGVRIIYNDDTGAPDAHNPVDARLYPDLEEVAETAAEVDAALRAEGFRTVVTPLRASGRGALTDFVREISAGAEGMIFNICEGAFGRSSLEMNVAALLELHGLKFTGSPSLTLGLSLDKGLSKDILSSRGIMTPDYCVLNDVPSKLKGHLDFPLIVKPLREDASIGIDSGAVVSTMKELKARVELVLTKYKQPAIIEEYIEGREFNVAVIGNGKEMKALPLAELTFVDFPAGVPRICSYEAKWLPTSVLYKKTVPQCPADVSEELQAEMTVVAERAYEAMGCRDYARVDMRVGESGILKVLEVNPNPDLSSNAGLARAAGAAGFSYSKFIAGIVATAAKRYE